MQTRTSAGTSINSTKLPRIYTVLKRQMEGHTFVDYGCGKYTSHITQYAEGIGADVHFFDPYNQPDEVNQATITMRGADFAVCSNVLNVIDSDDAVRECIKGALALGCGLAYFTVYEGDKTGKGAETQQGKSWQRNAPVKSYARFAPSGASVSFKNGVMIISSRERRF